MEFKLSFKDWNIERMTGYKPMTTCYVTTDGSLNLSWLSTGRFGSTMKPMKD